MKYSGYPKGLGSQRGITLVVGLIMVLLMTLVGMAAIRGSNMQELMAGNMRDHNLALQAAEAGLRAGENRVSSVNLSSYTGGGEYPELMPAIEDGGNSDFWKSYDWAAAKTATLSLEGVARQPEYVAEEITTLSSTSGMFGHGVDFEFQRNLNDIVIYRVSSRGVGGNEETEIILQSTYMKDKY